MRGDEPGKAGADDDYVGFEGIAVRHAGQSLPSAALRPSFTPPPLLFWAYVALAVVSAVVFEATDQGEAAWWGFLISLALLIGLHRGLRLAWWLLLIFGVWDAVAILAVQPEGSSLDGSTVALVALQASQVGVLLAIRATAEPGRAA